MTFTVSDFKRIRANAQCTDGRRITLFFFMSATKTQCVEGEGCLLDKSKSNTAALFYFCVAWILRDTERTRYLFGKSNKH